MVVIAEASRQAAIIAAIVVLFSVGAMIRSPLLIGGACVAAAEAIFAVCFWVKKRRLDAVLTKPGPEHDAIALMRKCIARITYSDDYLSSWFNGAPRDQVHKQNLREFMAYGFWFRQYGQLSDHDKQFMEQVLKQLEQQTGVVLPEGRNPDIQFLSHLWDPLKVSYKPLMFYVCMEVLALASACMLQAAGFRRCVHNGDVFYTYKVAAADASSSNNVDDDDPLAFVHGVGAGLLPYLLFVYKLWSTGRPLILPEYKHISMRCTSRVPTVQECAESLSEFLDSINVRSVHVMGHSYGTLVCARFAIVFPGQVSSLALMDPVCFAMYMPRLIRTFLYAKSPNSGSWLLDQALLMVAKELHCAATFCRQFLWHDYNLWPERLPARTLVALSGGDVLCPAADVKQHLEEETAARVVLHPTLYHGAVLLWPSYADMVIKGWQQMLLDPAPIAAARVLAAAAQQKHTEPVLLHGTTTTAAPVGKEGEQQDPADASAVLSGQDQLCADDQQHQKQRDFSQQLWLQQWQEPQELQEHDITPADTLLDVGSKRTAITTSVAAVKSSNSSSSGVTALSGTLHSRQGVDCPFHVLDVHQHSSESLLALNSLAAADCAAYHDKDTSGGSGSSCIGCERCRSVSITQQQQQEEEEQQEDQQQGPTSSDADGSNKYQMRVRDRTSLKAQQPGSCLPGAGSISCRREGLAILCDCCCQQQWQQQAIKASCA